MSGETARTIAIVEGVELPDDGRTWRYLPTGRTRHVLASPTHLVAACGVVPGGLFPRFEDWYGTGRQREREVNAALPPCRRCCRLLGIEVT